MTDLVKIQKSKSAQVSLADLQDRLDARKQLAETHSTVSTKKSRVEEAKRSFTVDPQMTLDEIQGRARALAAAFDLRITLEAVPLSQAQINTLSYEFYQLEILQAQIAALETRYRELTFAHLDETVQKVPGRPVSQVPGKMAATGPGPHYVFERRGGNRVNPDLDVVGLKDELPAEIVAKVYVTVHHKAVKAYDEDVFDEGAFGELVEAGEIDLDVVAKYLTAGEWRKPSLYKTLVDG